MENSSLGYGRQQMIISASGWRDIFAKDGDAESRSPKISLSHTFASLAAAYVFADFVRAKSEDGAARIIVGGDTRPTSGTIARMVVRALLAKKADILFCGVQAAPEIMAFARAAGKAGDADGFIYISASHNPIGYNGFKFGLTDGGVLAGAEAALLEKEFHSLCTSLEGGCLMLAEAHMVESEAINEVLNREIAYKDAALAAYLRFCANTAAGGSVGILTELKQALEATPYGIAADFNGSARTLSIDKIFFESFHLKFHAVNFLPGDIVHQIVPDGEALTPCRDFLNELRRRDSDFVLGYTPDCDGDRGNIVIFDESLGLSRPLDGQEALALVCLAELCQLVWTGERHLDDGGVLLRKTAIAVNDATSMRIDRIALAFGAKIFRAETGEANVVGLGRRLRNEGWTVPVMGEGAAGGCIVHPSSVRDPLQTVMALVKMLSIRSREGKKGFFELWLERNGGGKPCPEDFTLSDVAASLPAFTTTSAYSDEARLQIKDSADFKERYQDIFLAEWEKQKDRLFYKWGICGWEAAAYNESVERRGLENFGEAGRGGLRLYFHNAGSSECASLWMRGSGTEPVFRVMADVEGVNPALHHELLEWHSAMALRAAGVS
jgi:phosphoglucomutase